jgi:hypothetical protein
MKKLAPTFVLGACLAASAASAQIVPGPCPCPPGVQPMEPLFDVEYHCRYSSPWQNEVNPGRSTFTDKRQFPSVTYGIELYDATTPTGRDNRRIAFAHRANACHQDESGLCEIARSRYEFSVVNGPRCENTTVLEFGHRIEFRRCDNGKTRTCTTY